LNLNYFKAVEDMGLKLLHRGSLEWHHRPKQREYVYTKIICKNKVFTVYNHAVLLTQERNNFV
jgi:hypothetical protein